MKTAKRLFACALLCTILGSAAACGDTPSESSANTPDNNTAAVTDAVTEAVQEAVYPYEAPDLGGYALRVYNSDDLWDMYMNVDADTMTGEPLNDAVYNRNRKVENLLNCKFEVTKKETADSGLESMTDVIKKTITAGDDAYDVIYSSINTTPAMVSDGYFLNLHDVQGLHLDQPWWDQIVASNITIEDCLYFATSPMHLMSLDGAWCLYFNENIMHQNDMALPYDLVRNGTWTLDKLMEYIKPVTNLNGDASFKWSQTGTCMYGISAHVNAPDKFILGCGEYFIEKDKSGALSFGATDEQFYNSLSKIASVLDNTSGLTINASTTDFDAEAGGYMYIFSVGRSLFLTAEIKAAQELRDMKDTFGILPYPKYDEAQETYHSSFVNQCLFYTIPVTNSHLKETAIISDVTSYQSYMDVLPVYYNTIVEQKGLRNEDSIEMLNIIRSSNSVELGVLFGWTSDLMTTIRTKLYAGDGALASTIEKKQSTIEKNIQKTMDAIHTTQANS